MIFCVYKPIGPSSNKVLNQIRRLAGTKRVGHAGTLDPLASGVLVVAINRPSTKQLTEVVKQEKEYLAGITLGVTTTTDDEEGEKTINELASPPTQEQVESVLTQFVGEIMQTPPIFSAIKIDGKEAYKYARKGQDIVMQARPALIKEIELISYSWPVIQIRVVTGKGVYIRSLARDIGEQLKTGAYMSALERIRVGQFTKEGAIKVENLEAFIKKHTSLSN